MSKRGMAAMDAETRERIATLGGQKVLEKYGRDHFREIGKKGGKANFEKRGKEHMAALGRKGGLASKITTEERNENPVYPEKE